MIDRTTLAAERGDLDLLRAEARRRGISLAQLLRELVAREAADLRARRRPRTGFVAGGGASAADQSWQDEELPAARGFR